LDTLTKDPIAVAYRPWEEQEENLKRREEIKNQLREERRLAEEKAAIEKAKKVVGDDVTSNDEIAAT
jgi:hypothetical protein